MTFGLRNKVSSQGTKHRFPHKGMLPEGRHYSLTWAIEQEFGGMTTVVLERSSAFARQDNRRVEILTLSPEMKIQDRDKELHSEGRIDPRVKVRNLWKDLTAWPDRKLRRMLGTLELEGDAVDDILPHVGDEWSEYRRADDGTVLQIDRYRDNGELLVTDRFDMKRRGQRSGRRITLFDRQRNIIGQWSKARAFYQAWLDVVFDGKPSYLISDSAFAGGLIHDYRRDNVISCQVLHSHHLEDPKGGAFGALSSGKFEFIRHLDSFDLATTLTDQQRLDMNEAELSAGTLTTVSNPAEDLRGDPTVQRDPKRGAMIARLVRLKRVEDAVQAIAKVAEREPGIVLDVYGEGSEQFILNSLAQDLGAAGAVRLHGHTAGAKHNFHTSSFSLLTSRHEGQGLVILESMSAGCIPIAYDIAYGPADIIQDGVNGFTVPEGDVDALASAIVRITEMGEEELQRMRRAAIGRAANFFERPIVQRWGEVLAEKSFDPIVRLVDLRARLSSAMVTDGSLDLVVEVDGIDETTTHEVFVSWKARKGTFYGRTSARIANQAVRVTVSAERLASIPPGPIDISVDLVGGRSLNRARISSEDSNIMNQSESMSLYTTAYGNLSGRIHAPTEEGATVGAQLASVGSSLP